MLSYCLVLFFQNIYIMYSIFKEHLLYWEVIKLSCNDTVIDGVGFSSVIYEKRYIMN